MTIGEQLEMRQPQVYNFLIRCFGLDMRLTERTEPEEFPEDDPLFRKWKYMMEGNKGVKL